MRFSFTLALAVSLSLGAWAQTGVPKVYKPRPSTEFKVKDPALQTKNNGGSLQTGHNAATASTQNLRGIEHESVRAPASHPAKKVAAAFPKTQEKVSAPIDIKGSADKPSAPSAQAPNALRGRLKQKGDQHY